MIGERGREMIAANLTNAIKRVTAGGDSGLGVLNHLNKGGITDSMQQLLLIFDVVVKRRLLYTKGRGNVARGGGLVALFPEEIERNLLNP